MDDRSFEELVEFMDSVCNKSNLYEVNYKDSEGHMSTFFVVAEDFPQAGKKIKEHVKEDGYIHKTKLAASSKDGKFKFVPGLIV